MQKVTFIDAELGRWTKIAIDNGGWKVRSLTIWISEDGSEVVDSVATRDGDGTVFVYTEGVEGFQEYPGYLGDVADTSRAGGRC